MRIRAYARLAVVSGAAVGVLAFSYHLGKDGPSTPVDGVSASSASAVTGSLDAQGALEAVRPGRSHARTAPALADDDRSEPPVDETKPHTHVVDPETGGLISVAGAVGTLPAADKLGPVHADPMPAGVDLSDPTDTASLLERAGVEPSLAAGPVPPGQPGVSTLAAHVAPSCSGTGSDGKRVQALYVHESSTPSRFADLLPVLRNEVANVDDVFAVSSEQTGGGRRVRWVHDADCVPVIEDVVVPDGALGPDFWGTVDALKSLGYDDPNRKYLLFADANQFCGIGTLYNDLRQSSNYNDGYAASFARVDANCWSTGQSVAAHELTHNLGGVQQGAPHATVNGHCWDEADIMCYDDGSGVPMQQVCGAAQDQLLDCNKDDYFNTDPAPGSFLASNWNTASSSFLDTVPVLESPPQVDVRSSTSAAETGDTVTFTGVSDEPVSWSWSTPSACSLTPGAAGSADLVCPSTVTGTVTVTATATELVTGVAGIGTASVSMTQAAAPVVRVTAPSSAAAGESFAVSATATGKAPFEYDWSAGTCSVDDPTAAATTVTCPSDGAAQNLAVTAAVTQADGQTGRATSYVAVAGVGEPSPTRVATTWSGAKANAHSISGTLRSGNSNVSGAAARLQVRWTLADEWVDIEDVVTDSKGVASVAATYSAAGWFRFAFDGDETRAGSVSDEVFVKVSPKGATTR